jgi:hypothetical protein
MRLAAWSATETIKTKTLGSGFEYVFGVLVWLHLKG